MFLGLSVANYAAQEDTIEPVIEQEQEVALYAQPNLQKWVGAPVREPLRSHAAVMLLRDLHDAGDSERNAELAESSISESGRILSLSANFVKTREIKILLTFMEAETNKPLFLEQCSTNQLVTLLHTAAFFNLDHAHECYQLLATKVAAKLVDVSLESFEDVIALLDTEIVTAALKQQQLVLIPNWFVRSRSLENYFGSKKMAILKEKKCLNFEISIADLLANDATKQLCVFRVQDGYYALDLSDRHISSLVGIGDIPNVEHIGKLLLNNNRITTEITRDTFAEFAYLQELHLSNNKISVVHSDCFSQLNYLIVFYLHNNIPYQNNALKGIKIRIGGIEAPVFTFTSTIVEHLDTLKNMVDDAKASFESNEINPINNPSVSVKGVANLLEYITGYGDCEGFLNDFAADDELLELLCAADFFGLKSEDKDKNEYESYKILQNRVAGKLLTFTLAQFKVAALHLSPTTLRAALKKMQLALVGKENSKDRSLEKFLGAAKTAFLKENDLWKFEISVADVMPILLRDWVGGQTTLDLSDRCLTSLAGLSTLVDIADVEYLNLNGNAFTKLSRDDFVACVKLHILHLEKNKIREIEPGSFAQLGSLLHLYLDNNQIKTLHSDTFRGLQRLEYLHIAHNEIAYVEPEAFKGLVKLRSLLLSHNSIAQIPVQNWASLKKMYCCDLSFNNLEELVMDDFFGLDSLGCLNVENNTLKTVVSSDWKKPLGLNYLQLDGNKSKDSHFLAVKKYYKQRGKQEDERREAASSARSSSYNFHVTL